MFNYNPNAGKLNQPMNLSIGSNQNPLAAFGGGTSPAGGAPTTGMDPMMAIKLMSAMGNKGGNATQTFGQDYNGGMPGSQPFETQRDPQQLAYQQAIMQALMSRGQGGVI